MIAAFCRSGRTRRRTGPRARDARHDAGRRSTISGRDSRCIRSGWPPASRGSASDGCRSSIPPRRLDTLLDVPSQLALRSAISASAIPPPRTTTCRRSSAPGGSTRRDPAEPDLAALRCQRSEDEALHASRERLGTIHAHPEVEPVVPERIKIVFAGRVIAEDLAKLGAFWKRAIRRSITCRAPASPARSLPRATRRCYMRMEGARVLLVVARERAIGPRICAWSYPDAGRLPFASIRDHLAVYLGRRWIRVLRRRWSKPPAQPGGFYGGWVTKNLIRTLQGRPGNDGFGRRGVADLIGPRLDDTFT